LVKVSEAGRLLGLSERSVRELLARRRLPRVRIGVRAIRIPLSALEQYARARYKPPAVTELRLERLRARIPLRALAAEAGIGLLKLSQAERGFADLDPNEERNRQQALSELRKASGGE